MGHVKVSGRDTMEIMSFQNGTFFCPYMCTKFDVMGT